MIKEQFLLILYSFLFGILLGIIYCMFSGVEQIFRLKTAKTDKHIIKAKSKIIHKIVLFLVDSLYFVFITPLCAIYMFGINDGLVRWYIVFGAILGFAFFNLTLGKMINCVFVRYSLLTNRIALKVKNTMRKNKGKIEKLKKKRNLKRDKKEMFRFGLKSKQGD